MKRKRKSERIEIRMTPETKEDWLRVCNLLPGNTQSKVFRTLVFKVINLKEMKMILMNNDNDQQF